MKTKHNGFRQLLKFLICSIVVVSFDLQKVKAQVYSHVKISDVLTSPGQKQILYDNQTTPIHQGTNVTATVFFWKDQRNFQFKTFKSEFFSQVARFQFQMPDSIKLISIQFLKDSILDNNDGLGYFFKKKKGSTPVRGASELLGRIYASGNQSSGISINKDKALISFDEEIRDYPERKKDLRVMYYHLMAASKNDSIQQQLKERLRELEVSKDQQEQMIAYYLYLGPLHQRRTADSLNQKIRLQFPDGELAKFTDAHVIGEEPGGKKNEDLLNKYIKKYHIDDQDSKEIESLYVFVAIAYANDNNVEKALDYINKVTKDPNWTAEGRNRLAVILLKNGHLRESEQVIKDALRMSNQRNSYYYKTYAEVLYRLKKNNEALEAIQTAYQNSSKLSGSLNFIYAEILVSVHQEKDAFEKIDEAIKVGQGTKEMREILKPLYIKVKGSDTGYENYLLSLNKILIEETRKNVAKMMINQPAPDFTLKDVNGQVVSLSTLKGKVVVLDFWATWCGPCKKGFPAMKMALMKFSNDPDVQFLFIHTQETMPPQKATKAAKDYVVQNGFPFKVLMDLKNPQTRNNDVANKYAIYLIPQKFIIDKSGHIRFHLTGFSEGDDVAVEEITTMVELAKTQQ